MSPQIEQLDVRPALLCDAGDSHSPPNLGRIHDSEEMAQHHQCAQNYANYR